MKKLRNLGPVSWRMLTQAGIEDVEALKSVGAVMAFIRVQESGTNASLNLLYAMATGLDNKNFHDLTAEEKSILNRDLEDLRELLYQKGLQAKAMKEGK